MRGSSLWTTRLGLQRTWSAMAHVRTRLLSSIKKEVDEPDTPVVVRPVAEAGCSNSSHGERYHLRAHIRHMSGMRMDPRVHSKVGTSLFQKSGWRNIARVWLTRRRAGVALHVAGHGLRGNVPLGNFDVGRTSVQSLRLLKHDRCGLPNAWALKVVVA